MPEPFKNVFNPKMIALMADHFEAALPSFDGALFRKVAVRNLGKHELKQRSGQIVAALEGTLPEGFGEACGVMLRTLHPEVEALGMENEMDEAGIRGWGIMPMSGYVARHGMGEVDLSMETLREMTKRFTAEFAVRPFLQASPDIALAHVEAWVDDPNLHVRRLASEGTRPRLPWGMRLTDFDRDPAPILPILEALKDDREEYVRRSVANSLNDIAKVHPDLVAEIAERWLRDASPERRRLIRHACRTLIKDGHRPTLAALGYTAPEITVEIRTLTPKKIALGETLEIAIEITSKSAKSQQLMIDYIIHHRKANGTLTPKVFKWKTATLVAGASLSITKKHAFKLITTRVYHAGTHRIEIQVNGQRFGGADFVLKMPGSALR